MKLLNEIENLLEANFKSTYMDLLVKSDALIGKKELEGNVSDSHIQDMEDFYNEHGSLGKNAWKDEYKDWSNSRLRSKEVLKLLKDNGKSVKDIDKLWNDFKV